jgi:hypothetical protein
MKREPSELFSPATLASFEGKDVTVQHPEDFVSPDNYQELTNGVLLNVREGKEEIEVEGEKVFPMLGDMLIKAAEAIELVKAGMREVSLGYDAFWELVADGEGRHSKIIGNHCALVDEGRAGKFCAITDSKKENEMFTKEQFESFKKIFKGKSLDEVMKDEEKKAKDAEEAEKKKEDDDKKTKDAEEAEKKKGNDEKIEKLSSDVAALSKSVGDLLEALKGEKKEESKDEEDSEESEEIVAEDEESEEDESEDEGSEEDLEDKKKDKKTGDSALLSKAEILAPGIKQSKDIKKVALATAYKTADGKKIIDTLTGGKKLAEISGDAENAIFNAASEMMKAKRVKDHAAERITTIDSFPSLKGEGSKTAEDINKQNAAFYNSKK